MNTANDSVLVVEDVPHILELLEVTLRFKGYPVRTATNGQEALDLVERERPALVVTDILMPKLDGFSMAQRLRMDPRTSQVPIIFLSATYITPEDRAFALSLGAVRFLEKPVDTEEFLLTVGEVLLENADPPPPLDPKEFLKGYRERLESKLRHKGAQIARTQRLLETLAPAQRPAFEALMAEERQHYEEIQRELDDLYRMQDKP